jgi:site-specific DNA recombinase
MLDGRSRRGARKLLPGDRQKRGKVERHIRYLAPLAYLSPRIVEAIENGTAPADLTVTSLAPALPHGWAEQEQKLGIS